MAAVNHGPGHDVLAVIVTRNGARTISALLDSLRDPEMRLKTLVVDNASSDETAARVAAADLPDLDWVGLQENIGVAAAYNVGWKRARSLGIPLILLLDQDSRCAPGCLVTLFQLAGELRERAEPFAAVCPLVRSSVHPDQIHWPYIWTKKRFKPFGPGCPAREAHRVDSTITSGTLYSVAALEAVGGFREEYFIDFVDHECHLRLRREGWAMWWAPQAVLYHELGARQTMTADGPWIEHAPYRYYYMGRNMTEGLWRLQGLSALLAFWADALRHARMLRRHALDSEACIRYLIKGIWHGLQGLTGPLEHTGH